MLTAMKQKLTCVDCREAEIDCHVLTVVKQKVPCVNCREAEGTVC